MRLEDLYNQLENKVREEEMQKTAAYQANSSNLEEFWNHLMDNNIAGQEEENMDNILLKQAAAEEALDNICIAAALDWYITEGQYEGGGMQKYAMEKRAAAQNLVLAHCAQFGFSPEDCLQKEAADHVIDDAIGELQKMAAAAAEQVFLGFMKAAADDAATANTMGMNTDATYNNQQMQTSNDVDLNNAKKTKIDQLVAMLKDRSRWNQYQVSHGFIPAQA